MNIYLCTSKTYKNINGYSVVEKNVLNGGIKDFDVQNIFKSRNLLFYKQLELKELLYCFFSHIKMNERKKD